jgi:hypothetical protein
LVLTHCPVKAGKARASTVCVAADTAARAVSAGFIAVAIEGIGAGGALLEVASGAAVALVAEAAHVLHRVPGSAVGTPGLGGEVLLRPAGAAVVAVLGTGGSLAGDAVVAGEALAESRLAVTQALVRALGPRMEVIGTHWTNFN